MKKIEIIDPQSRLDDLEIVLHQMVLIDRATNIRELNDAIPILLASIGDYTRADRVYTFELNRETGIYNNSNEWCASGVMPQIDNLQGVRVEDMPIWHETFQKSESIIIDDLEKIKTSMPLEYDILKVQDIHTVIAFPMYHQNELCGFIGVDNPVLSQSRRLINLLVVVGGHLGSAYDSINKADALARKEESLQENVKIAEEANRANQAKTDFLSRMAHDIRTPMNAVIGFIRLAQQHVNEPDKIAEYLKKMQIAGHFLQQIADDVLDLTRIESGRLNINEETVDIEELLQEFTDLIYEIMPDKKLKYICRHHDFVQKYLILDPLRLKQIYINLLSNAIKYTPEGGEIHFEVYEEKLPDKDKIRLVSVISDNGIGMSPEYMERMYEQFTRAVDTRVNTVRGSGLGLSIVKGIVDLMGGTIDARSTLGKGTTFCVKFEIPYVQEKEFHPAEETETLSVKNKIHLLIAEDNELSYEVASQLLNSCGISCDRAKNGKICVERFRQNPEFYYQAILMDMQMPEMNGLEATEKIRSMERADARSIPIIALTANAFQEDKEKCLKAGMTEHLSKPLDIKKLINVLYEHRS